jgi:tryptophan 7-halogenase
MAIPTSAAKPQYIIKGNGLAAWSAAAMLTGALGNGADVFVVGSDDAAFVPPCNNHVSLDGESTLIELSGKTPLELIQACNGGFTLGTCLDGWPHTGTRVFHAPGEPLPISAGVAAHNIILKAAIEQSDVGQFQDLYEQLRFQARCAAASKFAPPAQDRQSPRSLLRPALQIDGDLFTLIMRDAALLLGAQILADDPATVSDALLVIECDAASAAQEDWQDMREAFGFDHCLSVRVAGRHDHPPYTLARPLEHGLLSLTALRSGMMVTYCFDSKKCDLARAKSVLTSQFGDAEILIESNQALAIGGASNPWRGNHVRIGNAAAALGPLYSADTMLLSMQLDRLMRLLPQDANNIAITAAEYNRLCAIDFQQLSDFVRLPFVCNQITLPHWAALREQPLPEKLQRRIERFKSNGRVVKFDGEIFDSQIWSDVMITLGITPRRYDPATDTLDMRQMMGRLGKMVQAFDQTIAAMPTHNSYINQILA